MLNKMEKFNIKQNYSEYTRRQIIMSKNFLTIGSKPLGLTGKLAGFIMNSIHAKQYKNIIKKQIFEKVETSNFLSVLDIGCGGGKAINLFCSMFINSKIYGIDHSIEMVNLSRKVNKKEICKGKADIVQSDVNALPYLNNFFDIITAFDTINFWTDFDKAMNEIKRVLKKEGIFLIVNGYPKEGTKWWDFVKFKNEDEYKTLLLKNGFKEILITIEKHTIIIQAKKA